MYLVIFSNLRLHVEPMAGDIDSDRQLEPEHIARIEICQGDQQAGGTTTICQLIQHSAKACAFRKNMMFNKETILNECIKDKFKTGIIYFETLIYYDGLQWIYL